MGKHLDRVLERCALRSSSKARYAVRSTFVSDELAEKVGYYPYDKPRPVPLVVREKEGEIIGWSPSCS